MNTAMEMHDSYIPEFHRSTDGTGFILFHASVCYSDGIPGRDAGRSGWQNIRMLFPEMIIDGSIQDDQPYAIDGFLSVNGVRENNLIAFPAHRTGDILLSMILSDKFETTNIRAWSLSITAEGKFELEAEWDAQGNVNRVGQ